jgi:hypothetical protein
MEKESGHSNEWVWGTFGGLGLYLVSLVRAEGRLWELLGDSGPQADHRTGRITVAARIRLWSDVARSGFRGMGQETRLPRLLVLVLPLSDPGKSDSHPVEQFKSIKADDLYFI